MASIIISYFHPTDVEVFMYNLTLSQCEAVLGGYTYVNLINITDSVNSISNTYYLGSYAFNFHDNRIYTIDYTRSIYNFFYL
ncbi:hypothetical protein NIES2109_24850 [Nostoc sp. HK-01]|uniref:Uncharacterized protein n=1 Tax=Nostoc cycadae WK-1 TaxID=1861711 RepID=A0A2H6LHG3_9NOSO|nr:hypothetical protein NIES2109_24850 [Nostoc sp. HK-01]GBE92649.1 hypothetical protein NCWK1_2405 [Nostoc cycadae WK-1]